MRSSHTSAHLQKKGKGVRGKGYTAISASEGSWAIAKKGQLQEEKEARLNKTPEKEARGNMKLM
jgi:hypothetical protein